MRVKFHRCSNVWLKIGAHPCWKVQRELDAAGIEYELVLGPLRRGQRSELQKLSGQSLYPVIEFPDGKIYREQSKAMAARIKAGLLLGADHSPAANLGHDAHDATHEGHSHDTEAM